MIHPCQKNVYGVVIKPAYAPLGLLYIAACLEKASHKLDVLDLDIDEINEKEIGKYVDKTKPNLICFSSTTTTINSVLRMSKLIKKAAEIPIIVGGIHATIAGEKLMKDKNINFVVKAEAEETVVELVNALESGGDLSNVKGIYHMDKGNVVFTGDKPVIENLDELPFPARHLLKRPFDYIPPDAHHMPVTTIMTTRGCPGACTYCCSKQIFGRRIRFRSVKNVVNEIEEIVNKHGFKEIHLMDDCFTVNKKRVLEFRDEIKRRKLKVSFAFGNGIRADQVDDDIYKALKDLGFISVGFGVESGNEQILKNIKKGIKMNKVRKAFKLAKKYGFKTWAFFMIGLPGENLKTIRDTLNFAKELDPDFAKFLILKPYPGSEVFEQLQSKRRIFDFNYDHYGAYTQPVHDLPGLPKEKIVKLQKQMMKEFYLRPSKILKTFLSIHNFTQLKLNIKSGMFVLKSMFSKGG